VSIPALLKGTATALRDALGQDWTVGERIIDGSPWGAYKAGMGWFLGVYFAGGTAVGGESYDVTYSVGIDLTRIMPTVPTKKLGDWFLKDGELFDMAGRVNQFMLRGRGIVATACNAALAGTWEEGRGTFREQFHTGNVGRAVEKSSDWVLSADRKQTGAIIVFPQTFNGLRWRKLLSETWGGGL
jgi:hypothetical protein